MTDDITTDPLDQVVAAVQMVGPDKLMSIAEASVSGEHYRDMCLEQGTEFPWDVLSRTRRVTAQRIAFGVARREYGVSGTQVREAIDTVGGITEIAAVMNTTSEEGWVRACQEQSAIDTAFSNEDQALAWNFLSTIPLKGVLMVVQQIGAGV